MPYIMFGEREALEKGRKEGMEEGLEQGREQEALNILVRLARKKFPALTPEDEAAIRALPLETLEQLSDALLDFSDLEELRAWLAARRDV